jgi:23S rRNA pseudouridine1911/1915/1917 synthase
MASIGHPVIGDPVYGPATRSSPMRLDGQLLHAARLALTHPVDGSPMQFEAPLPEDFERALRLVRQRGYWRG